MDESFERPADLILDDVISPETLRYTVAEVAGLTGLSPSVMARLWRAGGLPWPDPSVIAFADSDVGFFRAYADSRTVFGEEAPLHFARAMGVAMARVGNAAVSLFLVNTAEELRDRPREEQLAAYELAGVAFNTLPPVLERLFRRHAIHAIQRWRQQRGADDRYDVQRLAVGFVDLVGFTAQTRDLSPVLLADLIASFEESAHQAVTSAGGEVVKLIGDEVMFVADDADAGSNVALALTETFASSNVIPRAGVAYGPVLVRGGDFHGPVVNVAARLTALADPTQVLVTSDLRNAATSDALRFSLSGRPTLKGFLDPVEAYTLSKP